MLTKHDLKWMVACTTCGAVGNEGHYQVVRDIECRDSKRYYCTNHRVPYATTHWGRPAAILTLDAATGLPLGYQPIPAQSSSAPKRKYTKKAKRGRPRKAR